MKLKYVCTYFFAAIIVSSPLAASAQTYSSQTDREYLSQLNRLLTQERSPLLAVPDNQKIAAAQYTCTQLRGGRTITSLNDEMLGALLKVDKREARQALSDFLVDTQVIGIYNYCPQYIQQLKDHIEANRQN